VAWYRAGGVAGVLAHRQGGVGQPSRLTAEQRAAIAAAVGTGRFASAAQIGVWIVETYGVTYRPGGLYDLLGRLRCHPKVPRPLHEKADLAAQAAWKGGASRRRSRRPASRVCR
jgi:transposase